MKKILILLGGVVIAFFAIFGGMFFTVTEMEQALVVQFGDPQRVIQTPGLKMKLPFIQDVVLFEKRLLSYDLPPQRVTIGDKKSLIVDIFTRFKIVDPLLFYRAAGTELKAQQRLITIIVSGMRTALGKTSLSKLLSNERSLIMREILNQVKKDSKEFGIDVVDVRITRADLPEENSEAIFNLMRSAREKEAKLIRSQGAEVAQTIIAKVDRERDTIIADGEKEAQITIGQGQAEAAKISIAAYSHDPQFFKFLRSMDAYKKSFADGETTFIMSSMNEFLKQLTFNNSKE